MPSSCSWDSEEVVPMTDHQKKTKIAEMRENPDAAILKYPKPVRFEDTVENLLPPKQHHGRQHRKNRKDSGNLPECGKPITQISGRKPKRFCSRRWAEMVERSPGRVGQKAFYEHVCPGCGQSFTAYGNSRRKYCSHECYVETRFKAVKPVTKSR